MLQARLPTGLGPAVCRAGLETAYRLWLHCRELDTRGEGRVRLSEALRVHSETVGVGLAYIRRRVLPRGEGVFWTTADGWLYLHGLWRVCAHLGATPGHWSQALLGHGIGGFRANLLSVWVAAAGRDVTISRARLQSVWGCTAPALRQRERQAGVRRQVNYALAPAPAQAPQAVEDRRVFVRRVAPGQYAVVWQMPNSYRSPAPVGPRIRCGRPPRGYPKGYTRAVQRADGQRERLYWTNERALRRAGAGDAVRPLATFLRAHEWMGDRFWRVIPGPSSFWGPA